MASFNGNIPTPANGFNAKVDYDYTQSIVNNRTTITSIVGSVKRNNSTYYPYNTTKSATIKIEYLNNSGSWVTATTLSNSSAYNLNTNSYVTFVSGSNITIPHKNDGTQQIRITFSVDGKLQNWYPIGTITKTITLTTIPRYATITSFKATSSINTITMSYTVDSTIDATQYKINNGSWISYPSNGIIYNLSPNTNYAIQIRVKRTDSQQWTESNTINISTYDYAKITDVPNIIIGDNVTVNFSNPYKASIMIGIFALDESVVATYRSVDINANSYTFNFTQTEIDAMYANCPKNSTTLRYYIQTTYNGATYYNYVDRTFSINVSINNPIFSNFEYEDINSKTLALTGDKTKIIKRYSNLKVTIPSSDKMITQNYAVPTNYNIIAGNKNISLNYSNSDVLGIINYVDANSVVVYAIDSRGNQTEKSKSFNIIPYEECTLKSLRIERQDGVGENISLTTLGTYSTVDFGLKTNNIKSARIRKRTKSSVYDEWIDILNRLSIHEGQILADNVIITNINLDLGTEYDIQFEIQDELSTYTETVSVSDGTVLWSAVKGQGVNFGGLYDPDEGGPLQIDGEQIIKSESTISGGYIQFAKGVMICFMDKDVAANFEKYDSEGDFYYSILAAIQYPKEFIYPPICIYDITETSPKYPIEISTTGERGTPTATPTKIVKYKKSLGFTALRLNIIAIGKWK